MLILKALDWSYDSDLASPPARWDCTFLESGTTAYLPGEAIPKSPYERAAIDVTVDGHTQRLAIGVIREWGLAEKPEGLRTRAEGIDLKAVLLDFKPTGPKIYKGMVVASDSTVSVGAISRYTLGTTSAGLTVFGDFFHTFQSVVGDVVRAAGGTAQFDGYDYYLAQEIQWETDQSANDVLQQVLGPFNVTERFKVDVFFEPNNAVWFRERGRYTPAAVEVDYKRLRQRDVRRSKYPAFNDIQVLGTTYTQIEPDIPTVGPIPGLPWTGAYTETQKSEERESSTGISTSALSGSLDTLVATTWLIRYYDINGKIISETTTKKHSFHLVRDKNTGAYKGTFATVRDEYTDTQMEYGGPHGEETKRIITTYVDDDTLWFKWDDDGTPPALTTDPAREEGAGRANFHQVTVRDETTQEYDADGEVVHSVTKTYRAKQPDPTLAGTAQSSGLIVERVVEIFKFWSGGQQGRTTTTRNYNRDGAVAIPSTISTHTEFAYGKGRPSKGTSITTPDNRISQQGSNRTSTKQVKAGPDNAQLKHSFPVLGRTEDCEYVRQKIITERRSTRYEATLSLYPNLSVVEGKDLTVAGPPARWEKNVFYLVARSVRHDPDLMEMLVRGLAWI